MKQLILISACFAAATAFGQTDCSKNNPIYKFDDVSGSPKVIRALGSNPEFTFMRNMTSARQVYEAIKRTERNNTDKRGMAQLNNMLMEIGYANGAKDLDESSISMAYLPAGTEGNMGSGAYNSIYCKLMLDDPNGVKSWKIASPAGGPTCQLYILAKCGNAFFPKQSPVNKTACLNVPVTLTGDPKEVTVADAVTSTDNVYIYYHKKHHRHMAANTNGDIPDAYPSSPLLLNSTNRVESNPETYKVTVTTPDDHLRVCQGQEANIPTSIDVEKESQYGGYYPGSGKKSYKEVSKRVYRRTARKMRKAKRKEDQIAALTCVRVVRAS